jgi:hypothetical protein
MLVFQKVLAILCFRKFIGTWTCPGAAASREAVGIGGLGEAGVTSYISYIIIYSII